MFGPRSKGMGGGMEMTDLSWTFRILEARVHVMDLMVYIRCNKSN